MRILLTGAAGFIGSHMKNALESQGHTVLGVDNFSNYYSVEYKKLRAYELGGDTPPIRLVDISDFDQISKVFSDFKPCYVVHLAAQAGVRLNFVESQVYITSNIMGFYNIVRCAEDHQTEGVLYASSSSVYGDCSPVPYQESSLTLRPKSIYGVSKLVNEMFADIQSKKSNVKFRGLRFFTVYGPWGRPDMAYFRIVAAALGQGAFSLFGDGHVKRDFTYIDDVIKTAIGLLGDLQERSPGFSDVVNVGGGRPLDMNYLIDLVSEASNSKVSFHRKPANALDPLITMADNSYLNSILGAQSFTKLEVGIERLVEWAEQKNIRSRIGSWVQDSK